MATSTSIPAMGPLPDPATQYNTHPPAILHSPTRAQGTPASTSAETSRGGDSQALNIRTLRQTVRRCHRNLAFCYSQLNILTSELRNVSLHKLSIHIDLKTVAIQDRKIIESANTAVKNMEERSKRMDMYLRSVEGATKGGSDDGTEQGAWGSLGGESHIKLPVLVRCMDDLASLLSVLTENQWIIGADLDHIPVQARELVPNLKYYAVDLKAFHGDIADVNDVPYLIDTTSRLSALLETITKDLASAAEAVSASKKGMETVQLNRFAGASFFSSVTATVIQFSYQQTEGLQWKVVNLFWIMSLALSIGAAAAAFAGTVRRDARYHGIALSLVHFWGEQPPVLTYWSVVCFVVGLVTFAWASGQSLTLKLILSIFACVWGTGILGVMAIIIHWNYATRAGPAIRDFMSHFVLRSIRASHPEEDNKSELESSSSLPRSLRA